MFLFKKWKHGCSNTSTYRTWTNMIERCTNPKATGYKNYGGRGITVCEEWFDFTNFLKDMGEKPNGYSIDRKDNNRGYFKENCIWSSSKDQANNRRNNIFLQVDGVKYSIAQFAEKFHLNAKQLYNKLHNIHKKDENTNQLLLF